MFAGGLLLVMAFHENRKMYIIPGVLCVSFGCMIREMAAYTVIPFILLILCYEFLYYKYELCRFLRKCLNYFGIAVVCILCLFVSNHLFYSQSQYKEAVAYNAARSSLVDYPIKSWEEIEDQAIGYSENDYEALSHYVWEDPDIIDSDYLSDIANKANNNYFVQVKELDSIQAKLKFTMRSILFIVIENSIKYVWFEIGIAIILCSIYLFWKSKDFLVRLVLILSLIGYGMIIIVFSLLGRVIALKELLMLGNLLVVFYFFISLNEQRQENCNIKHILPVLVIAYITLMPFGGQQWFSPAFHGLKMGSKMGIIETQKVEAIEQVIFDVHQGISFLDKNHNSLVDIFRAKQQKDNMTLLDELCERNELYIWNVFCFDTELEKLQRLNQLPSEQILSHNLPIGEWTSGQIYWKEHLKSIGVDNLMEALLYRENTYYVGDREDIVLQWLKEHYTETAAIKYVKSVGKYPVWQFVETGNSE